MTQTASAQTDSTSTLVCFAVKEEAKFFAPLAPVAIWITGMGHRNASEGIQKAIAELKPRRVLTCGFAGGLNPKLRAGEMIFDADPETDVATRLEELGAKPAKFYCSKRVAVTAAEKRELWKSTGVDAVEMESSVLRTICRDAGIPSATIRVISDAADQDLPLDFNALMTSRDRINLPKLIGTVLLSPKKIPRLLDFQRQTAMAACRLGETLQELLRRECR